MKRSRPRRRRGAGHTKGQDGFGLTEVLVAITLGSIGLLSVAGLQLAAATQSRIAEWRTTQALAAQLTFEEILRNGYAAAASGTMPAAVGRDTLQVTVTVTNSALRVRDVSLSVPAIGHASARTFARRIYDVRPLPAAP